MNKQPSLDFEALASAIHELPLHQRADFVSSLPFPELMERVQASATDRRSDLATLFVCYLGERMATDESKEWTRQAGEALLSRRRLTRNEAADLAVILSNNYLNLGQSSAENYAKALQMRILATNTSEEKVLNLRLEDLTIQLAWMAPEVFSEYPYLMNDLQSTAAPTTKLNLSARYVELLIQLSQPDKSQESLESATNLSQSILSSSEPGWKLLFPDWARILQEYIFTIYFHGYPPKDVIEICAAWTPWWPSSFSQMIAIWKRRSGSASGSISATNLQRRDATASSSWLNNATLARLLLDSGENSKNSEDISRAIRVLETTLLELPAHREYFRDSLQLEKVFCLEALYEITQSPSVLVDALELAGAITNPRLAGRKHSLITSLANNQYTLTRDPRQLELALSSARQLPEASEHMARERLSRQNYGVLNLHQGRASGTLDQLKSALSVFEELAQDATFSLSQEDDRMIVSNLLLAHSAVAEFEHMDTDKADRLTTQWLDLIAATPPDDQWLGRRLQNASEHLLSCQLYGIPFDKTLYVNLTTRAMNHVVGPAWSRAEIAFRAATSLHKLRIEKDSTLYFCREFAYAYEASVRSALNADELSRRVANLGPAAGEIATIALDNDAIDIAIEVLGLACNSLWRHRGQVDITADKLELQNGALAAQLRETHSALQELDRSLNSEFANAGERAAAVVRRVAAESRWRDVLSLIREIPDFEEFMLTPQLAQLIAASQSKALVLLVAGIDYGYVVSIQDGEVRCRRSESLAGVKLAQMAGDFDAAQGSNDEGTFEVLTRGLEGLVEELQILLKPHRAGDPLKVKILRTGPLAAIPIHSAIVSFRERQLRRGHTDSLNCYISYAFDLRHLASRTTSILSSSVRLVLAGMEHTPGESSLPGVLKELQSVANAISVDELLFGNPRALSLPVDLVKVSSDVTTRSVIGALSRCNSLHFAGHGECPGFIGEAFDPGGILVEDGKISMHMLGEQIRQRELAYLSGCFTGRETAQLMDQGMTIAQGLLAAGFRSVIATLWAVGDEAAELIAHNFYRELQRFEDCDPALALSFALDSLDQLSMLDKAPFVCFER